MTTWRVVIIESEGPTGIAPVCPLQVHPDGMHVLPPGGPYRYNTAGVYDCCPGPRIDTYAPGYAREIVRMLNHVEAEVCE